MVERLRRSIAILPLVVCAWSASSAGCGEKTPPRAETKRAIEENRAAVTSRLAALVSAAKKARDTPLGEPADLRALQPSLDPKRDLYAQAEEIESAGTAYGKPDFVRSAIAATTWKSIHATEAYLTPTETERQFGGIPDAQRAAELRAQYRQILDAKWLVVVTTTSSVDPVVRGTEYDAGILNLEARVFVLPSGEYRGGFAFSATNSPALTIPQGDNALTQLQVDLSRAARRALAQALAERAGIAAKDFLFDR